MEWVKKSDHDLVMLPFDFRKTYDKVNLTFLQEFMRVLGFSKYWIQWTISLYKEVEMAMVMNGQQGYISIGKICLTRLPFNGLSNLFVVDI
jgi:hypothetical protein